MQPDNNPYQDLHCPVCLEISRDAVQSQCCAHAFCQECILLIKQKQNQCPFCKLSPLSYWQSKLIRRMISGIKVRCPNEKCQSKLTHQNLSQHLLYCLYALDTCKVCKNQMIRKQLVQHTLQKHQNQAKKQLIDYQNVNFKSKVSIASTNCSAIKFSIKSNVYLLNLANNKNKSGRQSLIGTTGKHYCKGQLGIKCECCDGFCGPTNGHNCVQCMQIDIQMKNLPKGFLVNGDGAICQVDLKLETSFCGRLINQKQRIKCTSLNNCLMCFYMSKSLKRYEKLLI